MQCPVCDTEVPQNLKICPQCGFNKLNRYYLTPPTPDDEKKLKSEIEQKRKIYYKDKIIFSSNTEIPNLNPPIIKKESFETTAEFKKRQEQELNNFWNMIINTQKNPIPAGTATLQKYVITDETPPVKGYFPIKLNLLSEVNYLHTQVYLFLPREAAKELFSAGREWPVYISLKQKHNKSQSDKFYIYAMQQGFSLEIGNLPPSYEQIENIKKQKELKEKQERQKRVEAEKRKQQKKAEEQRKHKEKEEAQRRAKELELQKKKLYEEEQARIKDEEQRRINEEKRERKKSAKNEFWNKEINGYTGFLLKTLKTGFCLLIFVAIGSSFHIAGSLIGTSLGLFFASKIIGLKLNLKSLKWFIPLVLISSIFFLASKVVTPLIVIGMLSSILFIFGFIYDAQSEID